MTDEIISYIFGGIFILGGILSVAFAIYETMKEKYKDEDR